MSFFGFRLTRALLDLALPPRCHLCRVLIEEDDAVQLCPRCLDTLPLLTSPCCSRCGQPFEGAGEDHPCSRCLHASPPWEQARAAMLYEQDCRELIQRFKFRHETRLRRPLALLIARQLADFATNAAADCLIPVPLHLRRLRERGFNQSLLLAEQLSNSWKLPLLRQALRRTRWTTPQIELDAEHRAANLQHAFSVTAPEQILNKRIMLVDDVFTTGATLAECSRTLRAAGASAVYAVTAARAPAPP